MFYVRYFRTDLTTGEPTAPVDFAIVPYASAPDQHEYCVRAAVYRPEAQFYQIFEGTNLKSGDPVSLMHELPGRLTPPR